MLNESCIALVDCNNFFASCERAIHPGLDNIPVAILSSNDGCIIARSEEVKALGIPMGMPYFKAKDLIAQHQIKVFSLNYTLYTETSARIMKLLKSLVPAVEVYSIDEAFIDLTGMQRYFDLATYMQHVRKEIKDKIGIPVSIGIAPTKALSKLANRIAKKKKTNYVELLMCAEKQQEALEKTAVEDLWGVGRQNARKLQAINIKTGWDLRQISPAAMRRIGSIVEIRLVRELRGEQSLMVNEYHDPKRHIASSRSFGTKITTLPAMKDALTFLLSIAIRKLHKQQSATSIIHVSLRTARYGNDLPKKKSFSISLPVATDYPPELLQCVLKATEQAFEPGYRYAKGEIMFSGLVHISQVQGNLFNQTISDKKRRVIALVNSLNKDRGGQNIVDWAAFQLKDTPWMPLSQFRSDHHITISDEDLDLARPWW